MSLKSFFIHKKCLKQIFNNRNLINSLWRALYLLIDTKQLNFYQFTCTIIPLSNSAKDHQSAIVRHCRSKREHPLRL